MPKLHNNWTLWFHDPNDSNWGIDSYKKIVSVNTIEDYWGLYNKLDMQLIKNGMFFFMRENIQPIWEDEDNKLGGCWSFKVSKKDVYSAWNELSMSLLGEYVTKDVNNSLTINGISISPKKNFCIIKIWNNTTKKTNSSILSRRIPHLYVCDSIYKSHKDKK